MVSHLVVWGIMLVFPYLMLLRGGINMPLSNYILNGGFWYGPFHNNGQTGYGALFTSQGKMRVGKWDGIR